MHIHHAHLRGRQQSHVARDIAPNQAVIAHELSLLGLDPAKNLHAVCAKPIGQPSMKNHFFQMP